MKPSKVAVIALVLSVTGRGALVYLSEGAGVARSREPVSFGIPVKMGELPNHPIGGDAQVSLAGTPAQFKVLSKWYDGSARWVLATFFSDFSPGETKTLTFGKGSGSAGAAGLSVTQSADTVTVATGAIRFEVLRGAKFNMLNRVWRGNAPVVDNTGLSGLVLKSHADNGDSLAYRAQADSLRVEEQGPLRACLYVSGNLYSGGKKLQASGVVECNDASHKQGPPYARFMVRIYAYAQSEEIKVSTVLHNIGGNGLQGVGPGAGGPVTHIFDDSLKTTWDYCDNQVQTLFFSGFHYDMRLALGASRTAVSDDGQAQSLGASDRFSFLQATPDNYYQFKNGVQSAQGGRGQGVMDVSDGTNGVGAAFEYCWEAYPKRFDLFGDTFRVNMFPRDIAPADTYFTTEVTYGTLYQDRWKKCYVLPPGNWFRTDVYFNFHGAGFNMSNFAKARKNPLMPKFEDNYLHATRAVNGFYSDTMRFVEPAGSVAQRTYERKRVWSGIMYDYDMTEAPGWGDERQSVWEYWADFGRVSWGPLNMGDVMWADGFCNLHYDQTAGVVHSFIRTGNYKAWKVASMMARRREDLTTYHRPVGWGHPYNAGGSYYEKHDHMMGITSPRPTHGWSEGLGLYYVLTGDAFAGEAFREGVENSFWAWVRFLGNYMSGTSVQTEIRVIGWPILNVCNGYEILGDEKYYAWLSKVFHGGLIPTENSMGAGYASDWTQMQGYLATPLVHFYHTIKPQDTGLRDSLAQLIYRIYQLSETKKTVAGGISGTNFISPQYQNIGLDIIGQVDYLAFIARYFKLPAARDQAFANALSLIGYHNNTQSTTPVALSNYNPAVFRSHQYPGSETKLHGKIGIHARKLLEYEYDSLVPVKPGDGVLGNVGVEGAAVVPVPPGLRLYGVNPNPFSGRTAVAYSAPDAAEVFLSLYNPAGCLVLRDPLPSGGKGRRVHVLGGAGRLPSGLYFARLTSGNRRTGTVKLMAVK